MKYELRSNIFGDQYGKTPFGRTDHSTFKDLREADILNFIKSVKKGMKLQSKQVRRWEICNPFASSFYFYFLIAIEVSSSIRSHIRLWVYRGKCTPYLPTKGRNVLEDYAVSDNCIRKLLML